MITIEVSELMYLGAVASIIEVIFWIGVGAYWLRRKMKKEDRWYALWINEQERTNHFGESFG